MYIEGHRSDSGLPGEEGKEGKELKEVGLQAIALYPQFHH